MRAPTKRASGFSKAADEIILQEQQKPRELGCEKWGWHGPYTTDSTREEMSVYQ